MKNISNKIKGFYLLWCGLHFLLFLFADTYSNKDHIFFPFAGKYLIRFTEYDVDAFTLSVYDYTELLAYTIVPVILYFAYKLITSPESKSENGE